MSDATTRYVRIARLATGGGSTNVLARITGRYEITDPLDDDGKFMGVYQGVSVRHVRTTGLPDDQTQTYETIVDLNRSNASIEVDGKKIVRIWKASTVAGNESASIASAIASVSGSTEAAVLANLYLMDLAVTREDPDLRARV